MIGTFRGNIQGSISVKTSYFGAIVLLLALLTSMATAITPVEEWNKTYGGYSYDTAYSVQQTADDGYILAGYTYSYGAGGYDAWLIKTDARGNEQWNKTFGGIDNDDVYSVQQTRDGGYILAGDTYSYGADAWLIKTDARGNEQWNKTFGGTNRDHSYSVQQTMDGGYIFAGTTSSYGAGREDAWLVKTDASGNKEWDKTFGGINTDQALSVQQTIDGGYIFVGYTESYGAGIDDAWLVKTDASGNEQWNKTFGGISYELTRSVRQTTDGGYILVGYTYSYGAGEADAWLVKTDASGNEQWNKTFGGKGSEYFFSAQQALDGGYILAGYTDYYGTGSYDAWLVKTDASGNEQWNKTFGGINTDSVNVVQQTTDGGYILAGLTNSYGAGSYDVWLIKVPTAPPIINSVELNTTVPYTGDAILITVNATDNVEVTSVMANSVALTVQGGNTFTWTGTITALEGTHSVNVTAIDAENNVAWNNSTSYTARTSTATNSISGFKVNDTNGNGKWDAGEKGISNWTIRLIGIIGKGKNAVVIRNETFTDATGFYKFDNLSEGRYFVIEKLKKGFVPTSPPVKLIKIAQGKNSMNKNFTNRPVQSRDKKDDIDNYEAINREIDKYKEDTN